MYARYFAFITLCQNFALAKDISHNDFENVFGFIFLLNVTKIASRILLCEL